MRIAIPLDNGCLNGHFGGSREFAIVEVDPDTRATLRKETLAAPEHQPGVFPRWLGGLGVEIVIVGGIGQRAITIFAEHGIQVRAGIPGAPVDALVAALLDGRLVQSPEGCAHHERHGHGEGHGHHHDHGHSGHSGLPDVPRRC